jgi:hypothetical protein
MSAIARSGLAKATVHRGQTSAPRDSGTWLPPRRPRRRNDRGCNSAPTASQGRGGRSRSATQSSRRARSRTMHDPSSAISNTPRRIAMPTCVFRMILSAVATSSSLVAPNTPSHPPMPSCLRAVAPARASGVPQLRRVRLTPVASQRITTLACRSSSTSRLTLVASMRASRLRHRRVMAHRLAAIPGHDHVGRHLSALRASCCYPWVHAAADRSRSASPEISPYKYQDHINPWRNRRYRGDFAMDFE